MIKAPLLKGLFTLFTPQQAIIVAFRINKVIFQRHHNMLTMGFQVHQEIHQRIGDNLPVGIVSMPQGKIAVSCLNG
jgi:hypothetical protein